ncbi:putative membrane protein [Spathaspora sp. JA1]|nr:putative membrane protein [Spathaspora sp. JA1]
MSAGQDMNSRLNSRNGSTILREPEPEIVAAPTWEEEVEERKKKHSFEDFTLETAWETSSSIVSISGPNSIIGKVKTKYNQYVVPNSGLCLLLTSHFLNSIMIASCKLLVTDKDSNVPIHPLQILFIRMLITYILCLIYMGITRSIPEAPFGPKKVRTLLIMRGSLGFFGVFGLYFSLQYLSVSDAVGITFLAPMVTAFLAFVVLGESYSILEAVCSVVSFGGVILIAKPSFIFGEVINEEIQGIDESVESGSTEKRIIATIVGLLGVFGVSSVYVVLRKIGKEIHPLLSVSYFALICCIITFFAILVIPSLSFILPANNYQWFLFLVIGISGFFMQFSLTAGIQRIKASRAAIMAYSGMVFALFWDLTIWGHLPEFLSFLGMLLIIGNAIIIMKFKPLDNQTIEDDLDEDLERNGGYSKLQPVSIAMTNYDNTDESVLDRENR